MARTYNFSFDRGADFAYGLQIKVNCSALDISDWEFASQIRNASNQLVGQFEIEVLPNGQTLRVYISGSNTRLISDNIVYSDLFAYPPDGRKLCLLVSKITVRGSVTQEP